MSSIPKFRRKSIVLIRMYSSTTRLRQSALPRLCLVTDFRQDKMRCIFCKTESAGTRSIEHVIPESLGNTEHVLPVGLVCDGCNEYFGTKVEQPLLSSQVFRRLRRDMTIVNKRGRLPPPAAANAALLPSYRTMGRFIGKVGLEALAARTHRVEGWEQDVIDKPELDDIRQYVRYDRGREAWPFSFRTLYPVNAVFDDGAETFQILHEYDLLLTETSELYIIVAILGVEFALNLGGPELDGYMKWVERHEFKSPLYEGKNAKQDAGEERRSPPTLAEGEQ